MLKSKQSLTSARRSSSMSINSSSSSNAGLNPTDPESPDMDDAGIDLEIGISPPLYRAAARGKQAQKQKQKQKPGLASLASRAIEDLQKPRKVSTWVLVVGALGFALSALYVAGLVLGFLAKSGPSYLSGSLSDRHHHSQFSQLRNLVMVAGHSVYTSQSCENPEKESSWFLEAYQKHPGQASTFVDHIRGGIEAASVDDHALLLFSGGETRKDAGPRSEAQSYWSVAESSDWFGAKQEVRWRALTEEHARDSFENLLFSICRFKELTGNYPQNITVVSYDFKEGRFANLHRLALRFPSSRFFYKGTPSSPSSAEAASKGEAHVQLLFREDPYGCIGPLHSKRVSRDPFMRTIPYPHGCPELGEIFSYCGSSIFPGILPWD